MCSRVATVLAAAVLSAGALDAHQDSPPKATTSAPTDAGTPSEQPDTKKVIPGVDSGYIVLPDEPTEVDFWGEIEGDDQEDELELLRRARLKAAQDALEAVQLRLELGAIGGGEDGSPTTSGLTHGAARLVLDARLEAAETDGQRLAAWEEYLPYARGLEWLVQRRREQGLQGGGSVEAGAARATRMEAEIHVLKLRRLIYGKR